MCCHFLLQGIFPTLGSNPGLAHCRQTLYPLSHQGSPHILIKDVRKYINEEPDYEAHKMRCGSVLYTRTSVTVEVEVHHLSACGGVHHPRISPNPLLYGFMEVL